MFVGGFSMDIRTGTRSTLPPGRLPPPLLPFESIRTARCHTTDMLHLTAEIADRICIKIDQNFLTNANVANLTFIDVELRPNRVLDREA